MVTVRVPGDDLGFKFVAGLIPVVVKSGMDTMTSANVHGQDLPPRGLYPPVQSRVRG